MRALVLASLFCAAVVSGPAAPRPFTFPRSTPEAEGLSSATLLGFVEEADQKLDALHSLMLVRHGKVVAEGWWAPYAAQEPHMMFSLSKSFTSTAVGLAIAEGKLHLDDPVLGFFPDEAPAEPSANLRAMRIRDLLTMSSGHHDEDIKNFPFASEQSLVRTFLALPVSHKPGTFFVYNTPASYMLSAIVQKVEGQTVLDYLRPRIFEPLGIANPSWEASQQGVSLGGFGLSIRTEDIARFGQLYLQNGQWQGRQLVPSDWVRVATARQVSNGSSPTSDWEQGYGYHFWRCRHGFYRGDGAHGQFCIVMPQYDAVLAITSGTRDMASVMNLVWDRIVPAFKAEALPASPAGDRRLAARLAGLVLRPESGTSTPLPSGAQPGRKYAFTENARGIEAIAVDRATPDGEASFTLRMGGADQHVDAAPGAWRKTTLTLKGKPDEVAASGAWTAADTYTLKICQYRTPFVTTYQLRFAGDQLAVDSTLNVGPDDTRSVHFVGTLQAAEASVGP